MVAQRAAQPAAGAGGGVAADSGLHRDGAPHGYARENRRQQQRLLLPSIARRARASMDDWSTIDWADDLERLEAQQRHTTRQRAAGALRVWARVWEDCQGWVAVLVTGVLAGAIAGLVDTGSEWLGDLKQGVCRDYFWLSKGRCCPSQGSGTPAKLFHGNCARWGTWAQVLGSTTYAPETVDLVGYCSIAVGYAVLCAWLVRTLAPYASGSGIPEIKTILSGIHIPRYLGGWTLLLKSVGLCLSVGSGMSLGKEGPFVHVATCVGNLVAGIFAKYRRHESKRRELLSASAAAGVAVAFGAPIGGVLFSLEEASYYFPHKTMWRAFFCAMAGVMVLKSIDPSARGRLVMFQVDFNHPWHWFELLPHTLIGVMGGIVGAFFNASNVRWLRIRKRTALQHAPVLEVATIALISAAVNWTVPYMRGGSTEFLSHLFQECRPDDHEGLCDHDSSAVLARLLAAAWMKLLLTIVTFGIRIPAGLFVPSLFIGACMGRIIGMWVKAAHGAHPSSYLFSECQGLPSAVCVIPGVYAIVGAAAVLGGVTRMTLSLVVIIFELTGRLEYLVPVMLAVIISKWVGGWVGTRHSIYEMHIELNGYPYLDPKREVTFLASTAEVMTTESLRVVPAEGWTVRAVNDLLDSCDFRGFPVVFGPSDWHIAGWIGRVNLIHALEKAAKHGSLVGQETQVVFCRNVDGSWSEPDASRRVHGGTPPAHAPPAAAGGGGAHAGGSGGYLDASSYIDPTPMQIAPDMSVNRLLHLFKSLGLRSCLVSRHNKLQGVVTRKDLLDFLNHYDRSEEETTRRRDEEKPHAAAADIDGPLSPEVMPRWDRAAATQMRRAPLGDPAPPEIPRGGTAV